MWVFERLKTLLHEVVDNTKRMTLADLDVQGSDEALRVVASWLLAPLASQWALLASMATMDWEGCPPHLLPNRTSLIHTHPHLSRICRLVFRVRLGGVLSLFAILKKNVAMWPDVNRFEPLELYDISVVIHLKIFRE